MRDVLRFTGFAGLVLLLFGLASYGLTGLFDLWTAVHVAGGAVLLAVGILLNLAGVRRTVASRGARQRAQAVVGALLFGGILVAANVLAARHPWRYDATERKIHTLSEPTRAALARLDQDVELLAFVPTGDPSRPDLEDLLGRYAAASPRVRWRFVDPEREPQLADRLQVRHRGVVVAQTPATSAQSQGDASGTMTEGVVTNLILKVTRPGPRTVYLLTGHGEAAVGRPDDPDGLDALAEALKRENFEVRPLLLSAEPKVPDDAALVIVAGPRKPFLPHEVEAMRAALGRGGRALLLLDPGTDPGASPILADYRVALGDDLIVDQEEIPFLGPRLGLAPIVEDFPPHPITRDFRERIVLFEARTVDARREGGLPGAEAQVIARTRASAWGAAEYREILASGRVRRSPKDLQGPLPVAVAATAPAKGSPAGADAAARARSARLVVIGTSRIATNAHVGDYFNTEFVLNAVQWLSGNEDLIAEKPRGYRPSRLDMSEGDYRTLFRFGVLFLPEALLIVGLGVWWWRRSL